MIRKPIAWLAGAGLLILSGLGFIYAVRATVAQGLYFRAKYGADRGNPETIVRLCETAHRLYPRHYYFCLWAAESAYYAALDKTGADKGRLLAAARTWCDAGLRLNPYRSPLRRLKAQLLAEESPASAARYWGDYVEWHFWEPYNHAFLVELHAAAGDFDKAVDELRWVRNSQHYGAARAALNEAWKRQSRFPSELVGRPPAPPRR